LEFLEIADQRSTSYGVSLQTMFPLVYLGNALNSTPSIPAGFAKFLSFGGGTTLFGLGITDLSVFARMSRSNGRVLLRSVLRSTTGQEASLHVGDKFPIVTSTFLVQGGEDFPSVPPAFTFEDLGVLLKVKPEVHGDGEVSLEIEAEFKVLTGEAVNSIPVIANRKLQSKIRLKNGEWAAIAGLMTANEARSISGLAGLSQLPGAGPLFRNNTTSSDSQTVLLLLRPVLLSLPPGDIASQTVFLGAETRPRTPL
jgi:type II secretory pathway component GspD/PulD (secretin)